MTDDTEFEALKAEIQRHDAEPEDLAVVRSDELADLRDENSTLEERVSDLEDEKESLEDEMEDLESEVTEAKQAYAEALEEYTFDDAEGLMERYDLGELREKLDDIEDAEGLASEPAPKGGSPSPDGEPSTPELTAEEKRRHEVFLSAGGEENLRDGWRQRDREDYIAEYEARVEHMEASDADSRVREHALEQHQEMLAELRGEE